MASTPQAMPDVDGVGADQVGHEVVGLLGRAALAVDGGGRRLVGEALAQPGGAGDVGGLLPGLGHAAADDLLDVAGIDPGPLDQLHLDVAQELGGVESGHPAVALPDRAADCFDDHWLGHGGSPLRWWSGCGCDSSWGPGQYVAPGGACGARGSIELVLVAPAGCPRLHRPRHLPVCASSRRGTGPVRLGMKPRCEPDRPCRSSSPAPGRAGSASPWPNGSRSGPGPRPIRGGAGGPGRGGPALHGRAQAPALPAVPARAHQAVERHRAAGRRLHLRGARVQLRLQRGDQERHRLPARGVGVQAGGIRQLRRGVGRHPGRPDAQAGGDRASRWCR